MTITSKCGMRTADKKLVSHPTFHDRAMLAWMHTTIANQCRSAGLPLPAGYDAEAEKQDREFLADNAHRL